MKAPVAAFERIWIGHAAEVPCACCEGTLDVHQPEPERPERLLGTCPDCGAWYLIDDDAHMMLALPDPRVLRDA